MTLTLTNLLIATLVAGSAVTVTGFQATAPSPALAAASSTPHQTTAPATSGESEVLVFPANRFAANSAGMKPVPPRIVRLTPVAAN